MAETNNGDDLEEDPRIDVAVEEFMRAQESGQPLDPDTWISLQPSEIRPPLKEFLRVLGLLSSPSPTLHRSRHDVPQHLPDCERYTSFYRIGWGGMGAVYRATDTVLGREVAVKILHDDHAKNRSRVASFQDEARVASQLQHPNIVPVYDSGAKLGELERPFFTMRLVAPRTLLDAIKDYHSNPTDAGGDELLRQFISVCGAMAYAHSRGVLHRDLKPQNIMVGTFGEVQVMDWGLSKFVGGLEPVEGTTIANAIQACHGHTVAGTVKGTLAYMSPEQARGEPIDCTADVFSLGAVLFHIFTNVPLYDVPVYDQADREKLYKMAKECRTGPALERLAASAPVELIDLIRRCLASDPNARPSSAESVGAGVREYLASAERRAREAEVSRGRAEERVAGERKRRRWQMASLLVLIGALVGITYGGIEADNRRTANALREQAETERDTANLARDSEQQARAMADTAKQHAESANREEQSARKREELARKAAETANQNLVKAHQALEKERGLRMELLAHLEYGRTIQVAYQEVREGNLKSAKALLEGTRPDLRGWEWKFVHRLCYPDLVAFQGHTGIVTSAAFSPDGQNVITGSVDGTARIWNSSTGAVVRVFKDHPNSVTCAAFSLDGSNVVTACEDRKVRVWDSATGKLLKELKGHRGAVSWAAFSPDGSRVVTASNDGTARVWDVASGGQILVLEGHSVAVTSAAFSPDGQKIVTASDDDTARVWNATTGAEDRRLTGHTGEVTSLCFSPDGTKLLTGSADGTAIIWDPRSGKRLHTLRGHTGRVTSTAFSPDGLRVVTGSDDNTSRVWDVQSGAESFAHLSESSPVTCVSFSPDGSKVVTGCMKRTANVWDATSERQLAVLPSPGKSLDMEIKVSFSPDGSKMAVGGFLGTTKVLNAMTGQELYVLKGHILLASTSFSSNGSKLISGGWDKTLRLWNVETGEELSITKTDSPIRDASLSPDGTMVVTGHADGTVRIWDARSLREPLPTVHNMTGHTGEVMCVAFSPDGLSVASGSADGTARLWNVKTGKQVCGYLGHYNSVQAVSFNRDGSRLITASNDNTARVWEVATGKTIHILQGHTSTVNSAAFSRDGTRMVTGGQDATARVWDAATGTELLTLRGHSHWVMSVAFSPDCTRILTAGGMVKVWDSVPVNRASIP